MSTSHLGARVRVSEARANEILDDAEVSFKDVRIDNREVRLSGRVDVPRNAPWWRGKGRRSTLFVLVVPDADSCEVYDPDEMGDIVIESIARIDEALLEFRGMSGNSIRVASASRFFEIEFPLASDALRDLLDQD